MKQLAFIILLFRSIFSIAYTQALTADSLKNGDLVFVGAQQENLSGAINRVTQRHTHISYDHVGLIELNQDSIFVLHASGNKGSARELLSEFKINRQDTSIVIAIYRIKPAFQYSIPHALTQAKALLGKPYNWTYILNDSSFYCSDYIERAFRRDSLFALEPMTFINPATQKTDQFWIDFYKKQKLEVPEGKPGCNPNGLAASSKIIYIGNLGNSK